MKYCRFLHERNANLEDSDKDGMTPVMVAAELGRADNLDFLIRAIEEGRKAAKVELDEKTAKKMGKAGINLGRNSIVHSPLDLAPYKSVFTSMRSSASLQVNFVFFLSFFGTLSGIKHNRGQKSTEI